MEKLPNTVRERLKTGQAGDHPDANLLAAFAEQALVAREREQVLAHLARCVDCRDIVAVAAPALTATPTPMDTKAPNRVSWFTWPVLRWGTLAACVVIVGTAVLLNKNKKELQTAQLSRVAEIPASAPATPQAFGDAADASLVANSAAMEEKTNARKAQPGRMQTRDLKSAPAFALPASRAISADKDAVVLDLRKKDEGTISANGSSAGYAGNGVVGGLLAQQPKPSAPAPTPVPAARDDAKNLPVAGRNVVAGMAPQASETVAVKSTNETVDQTVQVEAQAQSVETAGTPVQELKREPGKAKQAAGAAFGAVTLSDDVVLRKEADSRAKSSARAAQYSTPLTRWTISSDGRLQHSIDSGKSWQPVVVADNATFRALSFNGPDVWVGGASGLLYHSADSGGHWVKVSPMASGAILIADISAIEFTDPRHGKLTTSKGEVWLTDDGGQTWRKQS